MRATRVTLGLPALRHNLQRAREAAPGARVMAAIKANGYGHGLLTVARAMEEADALGVACINEAVELRQAGIDAPVVLLEGFFHADELELIAEHRLESVIHHESQIETLEQASPPRPLPVWMKIDTGMHRLGFPPHQVKVMRARLERCGAVSRVRGAMTHLACADDLGDGVTLRQLEVFEEAAAGFELRSVANSAGLLAWPGTHWDWVRPGIMLYGVSPFVGGRAADLGLRPVMTFHSELIAVNHIHAGEAVGYGGTWVAPEDMPVGVVAAGYGDGYPRHAGSGTPVLVNGRRVPLVGRVSMDMLTVDLREQPEARPGDPVVLWGAGLPVEEVAECASTIAYELLCGVTRRVAFVEEDA